MLLLCERTLVVENTTYRTRQIAYEISQTKNGKFAFAHVDDA